MIKLIKELRKILMRFGNVIIPSFVRNRINAEKFGIVNFMKFASEKAKSSDRVLDAGAGTSPYKNFFSHAKYESTDFEDIFNKSSKNDHNFICNLYEIPRPDSSYDIIINTQVLEHVEYPQKVINEFYRILKDDGKLFLTAPQGWGIHGEPYHYFNFTKYGLESLFKNAGFTIVFIKPRGGMFWYLGERIKTLPSYIFFQYIMYDNEWGFLFKQRLLAFVLSPFYLISLPICGFLIPLAFFYLDSLDKKQDYTLGYKCYCKKENDSTKI